MNNWWDLSNLSTDDIVRLYPADLEAMIDKVEYITSTIQPTLMICVLTIKGTGDYQHLTNFAVVGQSSCLDKRLYTKEVGEKVAYEDAKNKLWQLMGFVKAVEAGKGNYARNKAEIQ